MELMVLMGNCKKVSSGVEGCEGCLIGRATRRKRCVEPGLGLWTLETFGGRRGEP